MSLNIIEKMLNFETLDSNSNFPRYDIDKSPLKTKRKIDNNRRSAQIIDYPINTIKIRLFPRVQRLIAF